jgi:lysophospholipase L1-like esterase
MTRLFQIAILICVAALPLWAQESAADKNTPATFKPLLKQLDLADGDTVVFLGDSITHQCLYTQYVEDFFYTRFPQKRIHFHNAGVGGDRAKNALDRFDEDVATFKPKYVTILLGMNDGAYTSFQQPIFDTYQKDMSTVLDKIAALGATAIPMTPTMHDARAARLGKRSLEPRDTYYNGVLALFGAWLREQAQVRGLGFVDMYSPLNDLTLEQRETDPTWTMIKDAVHPGPTGQVVMASAILDELVPRTLVSQIALNERKGRYVSTGHNSEVSDLQSDPIKFTFTSKALPWVLPPDAREGYKLVNGGHRFSAERLTVRSLKPGKYALKIDGNVVGEWNAGQLGAGVEIEENEKTPQFQQALKVAQLNKERNDKFIHPLRDQWAQMKGKRNDLRKAEDANDPKLEEKKAAFEQWKATFETKIAELIAQAKSAEDEIYRANQPQPHQYELAPVQ